MSPIPCPTPLRRTILRLVFSPMGLLCGFVVLLIATCPGARGDQAISLLLANGGLQAGSSPASLDGLVVPPSPVNVHSARFDRTPISSARSKTPAERAADAAPARPLGEHDDLSHSRAALPLLVEPLTPSLNRPETAAIVPMTGPTVGIRSRLPAIGR